MTGFLQRAYAYWKNKHKDIKYIFASKGIWDLISYENWNLAGRHSSKTERLSKSAENKQKEEIPFVGFRNCLAGTNLELENALVYLLGSIFLLAFESNVVLLK